ASRLKKELDEVRASNADDPAAKLIQEVSTAGPYLNIRINPAALAGQVLAEVFAASPIGADPDQWRYGENQSGLGRTLVIDLSSPNIAKPLAVHHLRSTMIGNSIRRLYEACGWRVVGLNYLGDWGTGFGKLIAGWCMENP